MPGEGFFRRWSRLKASEPDAALADEPPVELSPLAQTTPHPPVVAAPSNHGGARPLPTLDDAARMTPDSDFSAFVSRGVDKTVQRLALKTLFSDPHFKLMDGLDVYIDDYTRSDPVSEGMLAALQHARSLFTPPGGAPGQPSEPNEEPPQSPQGDA